jgi:hypothetical protein
MARVAEMALSPEARRTITRLFLRRLRASNKPIMLGVWRSEVGFEALYWLPFLRWASAYAEIDPKRFVSVTRGGANLLYGTSGVDLFTLRSVEEVRHENQYDWQRTKLQKQVACTAWDRDVLKSAATKVLGRGESYHILHPSWMYWALEPFWSEARGLTYLQSMTDYTPIGKVPPVSLTLPTKYVAMKWYARATFDPRVPAVRDAIAQITGIVGAQTPIVLLTGSPDVDDHSDCDVQHPAVIRLPAVAPEHNLAQQISVLAKATAYVGPYGGMAQLALRLGVPSVSLYHEFGGTAHAHLALSSAISKKTKVPFLAGSIDDATMWRQVLSIPAQPKPATYSMEQLQNAAV